MRTRLALAGFLILAAPASLAAAPAPPRVQAQAPVEVRIEKIAYPVNQRPAQGQYAYLKTNPNLAGKETYTTEAVVLENEYIRATVLPEFGARLARVTFKKPRRDLFWVNDVLEDNLPWSMGGTRFSFPFCEHGRHMDEGAGWRIVKQPDGSATVAMDMRFSQYAGEVERYGRFSSLRQATCVTLRPGSSIVEYSSRIDNRLPLPHGFRLWNVAHLPREAGARILLPAGAVTDGGAAAMHKWPVWDGVDHSAAGERETSAFAIDPQGDWAGAYYPDADANHLILKPRYTAPGTELCAASPKDAGPGRGDEMIEIWSGSNTLFEHPGNFLPPFGTYAMPLRLTMVTGIGRIDWAGDAVAVSYEASDRGARIRIVSFQARPRCTAIARTKAETVKAEGTLRPDCPLELELAQRSEPVLLTVVQGQDEELAQISLPWRPQPAAPETFQAIVKEMRPPCPVTMELADWATGHAPNLADAATAATDGVSSEKPDAVLLAARILLRAETPGSPRWKALRSTLEVVAARSTKNLHAEEYLGMMILLETGGAAAPEAARHLAKAEKLPGAQYLLGLSALARRDPGAAATLLRKAAEAVPPIAMGLGDDAVAGNDRLHPAATVGGHWPTLVRAATLLAPNGAEAAIPLLEQLLAQDPARPEAMAMLAEAYAIAGQSEKAAAARADAASLFQWNDQARRDYESILKEARMGLWSGIPRP